MGYYMGNYLRSSYEYAYALYLDTVNANWNYEVKSYDLGFKIYKPDFFIYDKIGNIIKVVEVKSNNPKEVELGKKSLEYLKEMYGVDGELVTYNELREIYKKYMNVSLTKTINEWINYCKRTLSSATYAGKNNPHYGMKHKKETLESISKATKLRWKDEKTKKRMLEGLKKGRENRMSDTNPSDRFIVERKEYTCEVCGKTFIDKVTVDRKVCSKRCAGNKAIELAKLGRAKERKERYNAIHDMVKEWALSNREVVLAAKYNQILPTLEPMLKEIEEKLGTKDIRMIGLAVFGKDKGRKELLRYMKDIASSQNVC